MSFGSLSAAHVCGSGTITYSCVGFAFYGEEGIISSLTGISFCASPKAQAVETGY